MADSKSDWTEAVILGAIGGALAVLLADVLIKPEFADVSGFVAKSLGAQAADCISIFFRNAAILLIFASVYYWWLLEGATKATPTAQRRRYLSLRDSHREGSNWEQIYATMLKSFLHTIDVFFGDDADRARPNWTTRIFWLASPFPTWTARSLDRCLLLQLIYPVITVYLIWLIWGDAGGAGDSLFFRPHEIPIKRALTALTTGMEILAFWQASRRSGWKSFA